MWPVELILAVGAGGVLTSVIVFYKKVREFVGLVWGDGARLLAWRRNVSKKAYRRRMFADHLESAMRRLAEQEEWRDSRFAELEAEVELEREPAFSWLRRLFGKTRSTRIHRARSLTMALKKSDERLIVLEGDPGAGKSVALRHLAQDMALRASRRGLERTVLPIYVNLKAFRPPEGRVVSAEDVQEFVLEYLNPASSRDIDRFLADEFESGREDGLWLFLFDSFDETPAILGAAEAGPIIDQYADAIEGFIGVGRSRGIIASREFRGPSRLGWPLFRVMPLTRKRKVLLIRRADLEDNAEQLLLGELGVVESSVQQLADNPLFLSLVCEYVRDHATTPESVHAVLESYVMSRLTRDQDRIESRFTITTDTARAVAEEMAFQMFVSPELGLTVSREVIVDRVTQRLDHEPDETRAAIDALIYSKLAKVTEGDGAVGFAHRRLHEYFATCVVIRDRTRISPRELLTNGRWRETAVAVMQTQPPEATTELLVETEALFRDGDEAATGQRPWRPGVLHVLDLVANGLKPDQLATHPIGDVVREILEHAWENGDRLDKKWVIELCAAAGTEHALDYLTRAFDGESFWLRNQAYVQVRRVGDASTRLEPQIRQMLADMSLGGTLRRERTSVRAQLMRLANPAPLQRSMRLLLAAPFVAMFGALLMTMAYMTPEAPLTIGNGWSTFALFAILTAAIFLQRFFLVSDGHAQRYTRAHLSRFGLSDSLVNQLAAALIASWILAMTVILVAVAAMTDDPFSSGSVRGTTILIFIATWLTWWAHTALFLARSGNRTDYTFWPILPVYVIIYLVIDLRSNIKNVIKGVFLLATFLGVFSAFMWWLANIGDGTGPLWFMGAMAFLGALALLRFISTVMRRAIRRRREYVMVSKSKPTSVTDLQEILTELRTDQGVQILLTHVGKQELHRDPAVAEFLAFLGRRLEPGDNNGPGRAEWTTWWEENHGKDRGTPLREPSSETLDELGRILEDAQRVATFGA